MNDYIPYTYLITFHNPIEDKLYFYYGLQYAKGTRNYQRAHPSNLGHTYFSSSKIIKRLIKEFGTQYFTFEVRKTFPNNPAKAAFYEHKVLRRLKVLQKECWLNRTDNKRCDGSYIDYSRIDYNKAKDTRRKNGTWYRSLTKGTTWNDYYGKERADEIRTKVLKNRKSQKGTKKSPESVAKTAAALKGRPKSQEHKDKIAATLRKRKLTSNFSDRIVPNASL